MVDHDLWRTDLETHGRASLRLDEIILDFSIVPEKDKCNGWQEGLYLSIIFPLEPILYPALSSQND